MIMKMYITLMPVIFAGICNMLFTKTSFYKQYKKPIDKSIRLSDGERVLGENKTTIGFISMIVFAAIIQVLWGFLCLKVKALKGKNLLYEQMDNTVLLNLIIGSFFGFAYMICELPNSFIKRRLKIKPGKTNKNWVGKLFFVVDQIDSIIGVTLILCLFYKMTVQQFIQFVLLGGITHIGVNLILYRIKIRKNI